MHVFSSLHGTTLRRAQRRRRRAAALVILNTAAAPADAAPAAQAICPGGAPVLSLANPDPGDVLSTGDFVVSGAAFDPVVTSGSGIARVDLFLGDRDNGGLFLGSTTPAASGQLFQIKANLPNSANGGHDFVAYAYALNGQETTVAVPVFVGAAPTPTPTSSNLAPVALVESTTSTCRASSVAAPVAPAAAATPSAPAAPGAPSSPVAPQVPLTTSAAPVLQLANPAPATCCPTPTWSSKAWPMTRPRPRARASIRSKVFLDSRDSGGVIVGSGVPGAAGTLSNRAFRITAKLSNVSNGGHNLVVYARSSRFTGQETFTSVPVASSAPHQHPPRAPRATSSALRSSSAVIQQQALNWTCQQTSHFRLRAARRSSALL